MSQLNLNFDFLKITLASPKSLKFWGTRIRKNNSIVGQITKTEIILPFYNKPYPKGLFCEKIFGPVQNWECLCGKYTSLQYHKIEKICEICDVEICISDRRRFQMGFISLSTDVAHIWYLHGIPSFLSLILNISKKYLNQIIYFSDSIFEPFQFNTSLYLFWSYDLFTGASAIKYLLERINLQTELLRCRLLLHFYKFNSQTPIFDSKKTLIKRIRLLENCIATNLQPQWMILTIIPVLPPFLRPLLIEENGGIIISTLNELYLNVLKQNNRLINLLKYQASSLIINNERRLLQESIDILIDNGKRINNVNNLHKTALTSLSSFLKGKFGHFRENLLGKRVDYSGRAVIIVNPTLELYQCGLPYQLTLELFKPYLFRQFKRFGFLSLINDSTTFFKTENAFLYFLLTKLCKNRLVLLNRAPTLHKLGIQAFEPILVVGNAIMLHPLICSAFNADFDGDQMAVHLPLTCNSQREAKSLLFSPNNILSVTTGEPAIIPSQDMIIGYSYLSSSICYLKYPKNFYFRTLTDIRRAFYQHYITLHTPIWVCSSLLIFNFSNVYSQFKILRFKFKRFVQTTFGRLVLNNLFHNTLYR
uniref:DNA-directed RNA polymerase subunit n=1 Tax=Pteridomonas danica TaxID=38822 RepID=A0A7T1FV28_9STRA|nr:RNA polymerase beta' subunit [Pteridomonas danica]QPM99308.1 RNA polymerase beta' subunit [Pteridomonas danica]